MSYGCDGYVCLANDTVGWGVFHWMLLMLSINLISHNLMLSIMSSIDAPHPRLSHSFDTVPTPVETSWKRKLNGSISWSAFVHRWCIHRSPWNCIAVSLEFSIEYYHCYYHHLWRDFKLYSHIFVMLSFDMRVRVV